MTSCFRRDHPASNSLRILAININLRNRVIQYRTVGKPEFTLKIDFDERATMCLFRLVKLVPTITAGPLAIVKLIEGVPKHVRCARTIWIESAKLCLDSSKLDVCGERRVHQFFFRLPILR